MAGFDKRRFDSHRSDWETPADLFAKLNAEFAFTLDVAATDSNAKCDTFFTETENGLSQPWTGTCWCNPPYGRDMPAWLHKAVRESYHGVTTVCLIPARTNTGWFHDLCLRHGEVRFLRGRPKFGDNPNGLPLPLAVVVFRPKP